MPPKLNSVAFPLSDGELTPYCIPHVTPAHGAVQSVEYGGSCPHICQFPEAVCTFWITVPWLGSLPEELPLPLEEPPEDEPPLDDPLPLEEPPEDEPPLDDPLPLEEPPEDEPPLDDPLPLPLDEPPLDDPPLDDPLEPPLPEPVLPVPDPLWLAAIAGAAV